MSIKKDFEEIEDLYIEKDDMEYYKSTRCDFETEDIETCTEIIKEQELNLKMLTKKFLLKYDIGFLCEFLSHQFFIYKEKSENILFGLFGFYRTKKYDPTIKRIEKYMDILTNSKNTITKSFRKAKPLKMGIINEYEDLPMEIKTDEYIEYKTFLTNIK